MKGLHKDLLPSAEYTLFEIQFDRKWKPWNANTEYQIPRDCVFHQIYVPTTDSTRANALLRALVKHDQPVLFYGRTGTGKTMIMKRFLLNDLDGNIYVPTMTAFSANTTST